MTFKLEIGSVRGQIEAESVEAAYEKLRGLLLQIGMDLEQWYHWDGGEKVYSGQWHVVSDGHDPDVEITPL